MLLLLFKYSSLSKRIIPSHVRYIIKTKCINVIHITLYTKPKHQNQHKIHKIHIHEQISNNYNNRRRSILFYYVLSNTFYLKTDSKNTPSPSFFEALFFSKYQKLQISQKMPLLNDSGIVI